MNKLDVVVAKLPKDPYWSTQEGQQEVNKTLELLTTISHLLVRNIIKEVTPLLESIVDELQSKEHL